MSETLGEHKAPFQKIDNQFLRSHILTRSPGLPTKKKQKPKNPAQKNKNVHFGTCVS